MSVTYAVLGPAMALAGPLTNLLGARWIWAIGGFLSVVAGCVAVTLSPRMRETARVGEPDPELEGAEAASL